MARPVRTKDLVKGTEPTAGKGDLVTIEIETYLPRGDKVHSKRRVE
jgi:hypothetical protein